MRRRVHHATRPDRRTRHACGADRTIRRRREHSVPTRGFRLDGVLPPDSPMPESGLTRASAGTLITDGEPGRRADRHRHARPSHRRFIIRSTFTGPGLEDAFLAITGEHIEEAAPDRRSRLNALRMLPLRRAELRVVFRARRRDDLLVDRLPALLPVRVLVRAWNRFDAADVDVPRSRLDRCTGLELRVLGRRHDAGDVSRTKVLRRIYLTPLPTGRSSPRSCSTAIALLALQAVLLRPGGNARLQRARRRDPLEIIFILALGATTFVSLGSVIGAVVKKAESANNIASVLTVPLAFLSDAYIPLERLPRAGVERVPPASVDPVHRRVSRGLDVRRPARAFRGWIIALACWAVAGTVVSARFFRWV